MRDEGGRLRGWIAERLGVPDLVVEAIRPLGGGSIQENWQVDCRLGDGDARRRFVLRRDAAATIASSRSRQEEFAILACAHAAGVRTPEPIGFCDDPTILGAPFSLMGLVEGAGLGPRIVKDAKLGGDRARLAWDLGRELAKIHAIRPPRDALAFLPAAAPCPALAEVEAMRRTLDAMGATRPALEWGLRWAERHAPPCAEQTLAHRDFRTGNYIVDDNGLAAILDWEFAGWSDPMADLGWFCAECWRFGRPDLEAGGIAPRSAFYAGYESAGRTVDDAAVRYWEVVAHLRWATIALEQAHRHLSGREPSLELALTGRMVPELERAVLRATAPSRWTLPHA